MTTERSHIVLLVDDNEDDLELLKRAMLEIDAPKINVVVASDGLDAMERLETLDAEGRRPELAIVDLKMPRLDGRQFIQGARAEDRFATLPVLILSTSRAAEDVNECYRDGCNAYFRKPLEFSALIGLAREIVDHWIVRAERPSA